MNVDDERGRTSTISRYTAPAVLGSATAYNLPGLSNTESAQQCIAVIVVNPFFTFLRSLNSPFTSTQLSEPDPVSREPPMLRSHLPVA